MSWVDLQDRISRLPATTLAALCGGWIAITNGIAPSPNVDVWAAAARAFPNPATNDFIEASPIGLAVAHVLGADSSNAYAAVHLALVVIATMTLVLVVRRRFGELAAKLAVAALFASPLANVLLTWLGQPDPIVVGLGVVAAAASPAAILGGAAFALGFAHTEQALVTIALLLLMRGIVGDLRRSQAASLVIGLAAGIAAITVFKHRYGIVGSRLAYAEAEGIHQFSHNFVTTWHAVVVAGFGATWLLVLLLGRQLERRQRAIGMVCAGAAFAVAFFTLDTTRVFALVTFPAVLVLVGQASRTVSKATLERVLAITIVAGALYPHLVVWEGHTYVSSLSRTIDWFAR